MQPHKNPPDISPLSAALERFRALLPEAEFKQLLEELERPLDPAIRANVLKCDPEQDIPRWAQECNSRLRLSDFWLGGQRERF